MKDPLAEARKGSATPSPSVAVIIAAHNAAETISKAVISALAQPQTTELVVVDDASDDGTSGAARQAGAGDRRLTVIRNEQNLGPSASRNIAISASSAPYVAILDGDDFFLPNRFDTIFRTREWDFCADNIVFFDDEATIERACPSRDILDFAPIQLGATDFIRGNIPNAKKPRGELGFLKPVMRRSFIDSHGLRYEPNCRLGEDFVFYMQALINGARYVVVTECGYAALVRPSSLSGRHSLEDLKVLHGLEKNIFFDPRLSKSERSLMGQRCRSTQRRVHHREVLAIRREAGLLMGMLAAVRRPTTVIDILRDRHRRGNSNGADNLPRVLLPSEIS